MFIVAAVPTLRSVLSFSNRISFTSCFFFLWWTVSLFLFLCPVCPFLCPLVQGGMYSSLAFTSVLLHPLVQVQCSSLSQWHDAIGIRLRLPTSHFHTYPMWARSNASVAAVGQLSCSAKWLPGLCLAVLFQWGARTYSSVFPIRSKHSVVRCQWWSDSASSGAVYWLLPGQWWPPHFAQSHSVSHQ